MKTLDLLNVLGFILTALGVIVAIVQTYKARQATANLEKEQRARNATIWHNIALTLNAYETLEDARAYLGTSSDGNNKSPEVLAAKLASARRCVVDQYLDLLRSAVLDEAEFTEETVQLWKSQGRLENDWRIKQARKFVRTRPSVSARSGAEPTAQLPGTAESQAQRAART